MTNCAVYNFVLWLFHWVCEVFIEEIKQCSHGLSNAQALTQCF